MMMNIKWKQGLNIHDFAIDIQFTQNSAASAMMRSVEP